MFSLDKQMVKISNVNPRSERHGEETQLACDISIVVRLANSVLSEFHPQLLHALYERDASQGDLISDESHMPNLKFPELAPLAWKFDSAGYQAIVHYGIGGQSDIKLIDAKVNKFHIHAQEGGTVSISFRVQAHPDSNEVGKLCSLIQNEVEVTLVPPDEAKQYQMELEKQQQRDRLEKAFDRSGDDDVVDAEFTPPAEGNAEEVPADLE